MRLYELFADKEFHTSLATTFGIDFDAYENIVLPRLRGAGCRNNIVIADGRMLIHALGGGSLLPRFAGKSYTVSGAGAKGVFHPKLFLQVGRRRGRLIISSANLTTPGLAGNLEIAGVIECNEADSGEQQLVARAWSYLARFCSRDQQGLAHQLDWMLARTPWLKTANPATQTVRLADGTRAALLTTGEVTGVGRGFAEFVDKPVSRLIVISPFWDANLAALSYLVERLAPGEVSLILDKSRTQFPKEALYNLAEAHLYDRGDFQKGRFVHAKIFIAQAEDADHVMFGSANCTAAALGLDGFAGANEEASLYRRFPPGSIVKSLQLDSILIDAQKIAPDKVLSLSPDEDLVFDALSAQNGGRFECFADTLIWHPAAFNPSESTVELLDQRGRPMTCQLSPLVADKNALRFQISETQEPPGFAQVRRRDGSLSAPSIVTLVDHIRVTVREASSHPRENMLRQLGDESEATLLFLEAIEVLESIERTEGTGPEPLSIPKSRNDEEETDQNHRILSYEEFVTRRRPRSQTQLPHNSLGGSDVSIIRATLNRIIGHAGCDPKEIGGEDDDSVPDDIFDMADETADAAGALRAGEEFGAKKPKRPEPTPDETEKKQIARAKRASKDQILLAVARFNEHIGARLKAGTLDNRDMLRLRALLMVLCTAALPAAKGSPTFNKSRYQVLAPEGDEDAWPLVIGRVLFPIFGAVKPAIAHLHLSAEHDQIPDDILECWATIYWCVQACLTAPLSSAVHDRIAHWFKRIADLSYRLTLPTKEEMLGADVLKVMDRMSASYCERLGVKPEAIAYGHRRFVDDLFKNRI